MFQVAAEPPAPPPVERVLRADAAFTQAGGKIIPLTLTKGKTVENAFVRYQIYVKSDVRAVDAPEPKEPGAYALCRWTLTVQLQRDLCFRSMTGMTGCTESVIRDLQEGEVGFSTIADEQLVGYCALTFPAATAARDRIAKRLTDAASARADADFTQDLAPILGKTGVFVRRLAP